MSFVQQCKIDVKKPPTEADLYNFLEAKVSAGMEVCTIRSNYSHLNLACQELYKEKLTKFPSLYHLVHSEKKKGPYKKKT